MNVHKHMEVIFLIVLAVTGIGSYLFDQLPEAQAKVPLMVTSATTAAAAPAAPAMAVVVVKARRPRHTA